MIERWTDCPIFPWRFGVVRVVQLLLNKILQTRKLLICFCCILHLVKHLKILLKQMTNLCWNNLNNNQPDAVTLSLFRNYTHPQVPQNVAWIPAPSYLVSVSGRMDGINFVVVLILLAWISAGSCAISTLLAFLFKEITFGVCGASHFVIGKLKTLTSPQWISSVLSSWTKKVMMANVYSLVS